MGERYGRSPCKRVHCSRENRLSPNMPQGKEIYVGFVIHFVLVVINNWRLGFEHPSSHRALGRKPDAREGIFGDPNKVLLCATALTWQCSRPK